MKNSIIAVLFIMGCGQTASDNTPKASSSTEAGQPAYPRIIDSLSLQKLFDVAKWNMYCIYSDDTVRFNKEINDSSRVTFGSLELKFDSLNRQQDTTRLYFTFYKGAIKCDVLSLRSREGLANGVVFKKDSVVGYTTSSTLSFFWESGPDSRYAHPQQPDVVRYIKENKDKLDPWFRQEAKRKGVLE